MLLLMNRINIKKLYTAATLSGIMLLGYSCSEYDHPTYSPETVEKVKIEGKALYLPQEFQGQDWNTDENDYSYKRMALTDNLAIFWEKKFGSDLSNPPQLDGNSMKVDLQNLKSRLETFYTYYRDKLQFVKTGSLSEKYRMMVMLQYSLDGTAYGGSYDNKVGAFWAAPNRLQDTKLNAVAHELGHSFQLQLIADGQGSGWGGQSGFFEMTSQWMLWQVNPDWMEDENYHWDAFKSLTYRAFLHEDNLYHSPYVLEYWSQKHGLPFIAEMYRKSTASEDPAQTYIRMNGLTQEQYVDEMFDCYQHIVNLDYDRVYDKTRRWANSYSSFKSEMTALSDGWYQVKPEQCPENFGFNIIKLSVPEAGSTVKVDFTGLEGKNVKTDGYTNPKSEYADYRYGFVGITEDGKSVIGDAGKATSDHLSGSVSFTAPSGSKLKYLWLVVMGGSSEYWTLSQVPQAQWPYKIKITGSDLL